jgi:hypothetical protein
MFSTMQALRGQRQERETERGFVSEREREREREREGGREGGQAASGSRLVAGPGGRGIAPGPGLPSRPLARRPPGSAAAGGPAAAGAGAGPPAGRAGRPRKKLAP